MWRVVKFWMRLTETLTRREFDRALRRNERAAEELDAAVREMLGR